MPKNIQELKERVFLANKKLVDENLVILTWGNASAYDKEQGIIAIKPSGVPYETMKVADMVLVDIEGKVIDSSLKPSSDTPTHITLFKAWGENIAGVVHTHSLNATTWAQAGMDIPIQGTTHADYFYGNIPCLEELSPKEVEEAYEYNTGVKIVQEYLKRKISPIEVPGCLLSGHGPFTWGETIEKAVENTIVLETISTMALGVHLLNSKIRLSTWIVDKHYNRKHGSNAYYGQNK